MGSVLLDGPHTGTSLVEDIPPDISHILSFVEIPPRQSKGKEPATFLDSKTTDDNDSGDDSELEVENQILGAPESSREPSVGAGPSKIGKRARE